MQKLKNKKLPTNKKVKTNTGEFAMEGALFGLQIPLNLKDCINLRNGTSKEVVKELDAMALKEMSSYSELHKQSGAINSPQGYVTREAKISCSYGKGHYVTMLDARKDYGAFAANGKPLLTCKDCLSGINIHSFGNCFAEIESGRKLPRLSGTRVGNIGGKWIYKCIPEPVGPWRQKKIGLLLEDEESGKFNDVLVSSACLTCRYGGIITVEEIPENNDADEESIDFLVTLDELDEFGFFMGLNEKERQEGVIELNKVLSRYEINTDKRIAFFMGQVAKESRYGARTLEQFNGDPIEYFNKKYKTAVGNCYEGDGELFRGAGYIHLTGRGNYEKFANYIGDPEILEQGYRIVGGVYNRDISQIAYEDVGVIDVGKYAWEASGWFWKEGNPDGVDLSTYADERKWEEVSRAINRKGESLYERNKNINKFYKIITDNELDLPEEEYE